MMKNDFKMTRFMILLTIFILISVFVLLNYYFFLRSSISALSLAGLLVAQSLVVILFLFLQAHAEKTQKFQKQTFFLNSIQKILDQLGEIHNFVELKHKILEKITDVLKVNGIAVVIENTKDFNVICTGEFEHYADANQIRNIAESRQMLVIPIFTHDDRKANLYVAQKQNGYTFTEEEHRSFALITKYLAVSLENLFLVEKLGLQLNQLLTEANQTNQGTEVQWLRKTLLQLQEQDRQRIASDLHDSAMQDLYYLRQILLSKQQSEWAKNKNVNDLLSETVERLDDINSSIRQSCFDLYPFVLEETGIVATIRTYIQLEKNRTEFDINVNVESRHLQDIEIMPLDTKRQLFRIFQELFNNTKKHANASKVIVSIHVEHNHIIMHYTDDGCGFNIENGNYSGLGLSQIRTRLSQIEADWHFTSQEGQGISCVIKISK